MTTAYTFQAHLTLFAPIDDLDAETISELAALFQEIERKAVAILGKRRDESVRLMEAKPVISTMRPKILPASPGAEPMPTTAEPSTEGCAARQGKSLIPGTGEDGLAIPEHMKRKAG